MIHPVRKSYLKINKMFKLPLYQPIYHFIYWGLEYIYLETFQLLSVCVCIYMIWLEFVKYLFC